jgi:hypothetical protein
LIIYESVKKRKHELNEQQAYAKPGFTTTGG